MGSFEGYFSLMTRTQTCLTLMYTKLESDNKIVM